MELRRLSGPAPFPSPSAEGLFLSLSLSLFRFRAESFWTPKSRDKSTLHISLFLFSNKGIVYFYLQKKKGIDIDRWIWILTELFLVREWELRNSQISVSIAPLTIANSSISCPSHAIAAARSPPISLFFHLCLYDFTPHSFIHSFILCLIGIWVFQLMAIVLKLNPFYLFDFRIRIRIYIYMCVCVFCLINCLDPCMHAFTIWGGCAPL